MTRWRLAAAGWLASGLALAASPGVGPAPLSQRELPTTSARIYWNDLDLEAAALERVVVGSPAACAAARDLAVIHQVRGAHRDDLDEVQRGLDLLDPCVERFAHDPALRVLRARLRMTLHRFDLAGEDLAAARRELAEGADDWPSLVLAEIDREWNVGDYERANPRIRAAARRWPTSETRARLAQLESALGHEERAAELYAEAESLITSVDPLTVAWLNVQRGAQQKKIGDYARAELFFAEARRRLPGYLPAEEKLAEVLALEGRHGEAAAIYEEILDRSEDPGVATALAALYRRDGRHDEAAALLAGARRRVEALLERYPEATAAHAADVFLADGHDPARAVALLERNAALRPTVESFEALACAHRAAGDEDAARRARDRASAAFGSAK